MEKLVVIQRRQLTEELVPKYRIGFANFDIFANRLNDFILPNLSAKEFDILSKVYVLLFFLSHRQSIAKRGLGSNKEHKEESV